MNRYTFQDVEYYRCCDIDKRINKLKDYHLIDVRRINKLNNLYIKLKGWHAKALRMQLKMAEDIEPLYNQIEDLEKWRIRNDKQEARIADQDVEIKHIKQDCKNLITVNENQAVIMKSKDDHIKELYHQTCVSKEEIKKLRLCGICKHASPTSLDHLRCYGRGTPYKPVGRLFSCDNFKFLKDGE